MIEATTYYHERIRHYLELKMPLKKALEQAQAEVRIKFPAPKKIKK